MNAVRTTLSALCVAIVAAGCGPEEGGIDATAMDSGVAMDAATTPDAGGSPDAGLFAGTLAAGTFSLPAALAFGDPGFHEPFSMIHTLPADLGPTAGARLVVRLVDTTQVGITCLADHPTSGCATVDWSDFEDRPNVPMGGVFDNRISVVTSDGPRDYFLSQSSDLADSPDPYVPT